MLTQLGLDRLRTFLHPERVVTTIDFLPTPIPWLPISAPMRLAPLASIPIIPLAGSDRLAPVPGTASEPSDSELTPTLPSVSEIPSPASMPTLPPPPPAPPTPMAAAMATTSTSTTFTFSAPGTVVTGSSAEAIHLNQVGHSLAALLVAQAGGYYSLFLAARRDRRRDEVHALALGLELGGPGLGGGLVGVVEGLDGPAADVADGPDHAHPGPGLGRLGASFLGLGLGLAFGRLVQAEGFGRLVGGPQVA